MLDQVTSQIQKQLGIFVMSNINVNFLLLDGQAQAKRTIGALAKEHRTLKQLIKAYNTSVQVLKEHGQPVGTLSWETVTNVTNPLYTAESGGTASKSDGIPPLFKRLAVHSYDLQKRA